MKMIKILLLGATSSILSINAVLANSTFSQRFERIKMQAAAGEKRSQYKLALSYLRGNDIKTDIGEAIHWFKKSAKQGYIKAAHKLGMIYYFSKNGSARYKKAFYWFSHAAKNNHAESQYYLGKLYAEGKGVRRNYQYSLMWLKKAESLDFLAASREINNIRALMRKKGLKRIATIRTQPQLPKEDKTENPVADIDTTVATTPITRKPAETNARKLGVGGPFKPVATIVSAQKPVIEDKVFKTSEVLLAGFWLKNGKPAEAMPSALNKCTFLQGIMTCMSKRLNKQTDVAQVSYKVQTRFVNFKPNGTFHIKFRKKYIFVLPLDADDPNPDVDIPSTGWQRDVKEMKCQIVSESQISCNKPNSKSIVKFHK